MEPLTVHSPVRVEFVERGHVVLTDPLDWRGPYPREVARGFYSDGGSVPAAVWAFVGHPYSGRVLACYLCHDADLADGVAWAEATRRLDARLRAVGCHWLRRSAIVAAVRLYGWLR